MSERRRWTPVEGTASRVYDRRERLLLAALDVPGALVFGVLDVLRRRREVAPDPATVREVLVLRLDRMGDVLMSLPALAALRRELPAARIRLAVGRWSAEIAKSAPVDEVLVWSAPWVGRGREGAESAAALLAKARALRPLGLDLAVDLQGDVRATLLMRVTGARRRVGYANTGGAYLLTDVVPLDERVSWVEQNLRAVDVAVGGSRVAAKPSPPPLSRRPHPCPSPKGRGDIHLIGERGDATAGQRPSPPPLSQHPSPLVASLLTGSERDFARRLLENLKLHERRPLVGIHPSGGRTVKQWPVERWAEVAARLQRERGATVVVTGSEADRPLAAELTRGLPARALDFSGRLDVRETLALLEQLDLFLSPDTGPMHMATTVGTPSVSVFGPSDPVRYFSGGQGAPGSRHVVVRRDLWCSPCNLIRRPPVECSGPAAPECLHLVTVDDVFAAAVRVLEDTGHGLPRPSAPAPERV